MIYEYHEKRLSRIAASGDFEMAYHQALGTVKALCNDLEACASLASFQAWVVNQYNEIADAAMLEKITEVLETEIAADWVGV